VKISEEEKQSLKKKRTPACKKKGEGTSSIEEKEGKKTLSEHSLQDLVRRKKDTLERKSPSLSTKKGVLISKGEKSIS